MDISEEYGYIVSFAQEAFDDNSEITWKQLRSLWTAFCLHQDIEIDTAIYDTYLLNLWWTLSGVIKGSTKKTVVEQDSFDRYMGEELC